MFRPSAGLLARPRAQRHNSFSRPIRRGITSDAGSQSRTPPPTLSGAYMALSSRGTVSTLAACNTDAPCCSIDDTKKNNFQADSNLGSIINCSSFEMTNYTTGVTGSRLYRLCRGCPLKSTINNHTLQLVQPTITSFVLGTHILCSFHGMSF